MTAETEREAVMAWLRAKAKAEWQMARHVERDQREFDRHTSRGGAFDQSADAIERGAHLFPPSSRDRG